MNHKLFTLLVASLFATAAFSQQCSNDSLMADPIGDFNYTGAGFADPGGLPCATSGAYSEIIIPFKTYNQGARALTLPDSSVVPVASIYSIRIDGVSSLPSGMCWAVRPSTSSITGEQTGMLIIKGTPSDPTGSYPLSVTLSIDVQGSGSYTYTSLSPGNYKAVLGQPVFRIADANGNCPDAN
ncbi:MAG: hypothetical protein JWO03_1505 [Bacteroidetes bacterium]|nr:hypothetical protein [Bacteroidota bacterium]